MNIKFILPASLAVILCSTASCSKSDKGGADEQVLPVEVSEAITDSITLYKEYPGSLKADRTVDVVGRVNGTLSNPQYKSGDYVKEGTLLFTISSATYPNAVRDAEAQLITAKSDNAYAESHYEAVSKAYEKNAVSKMELQQALNSRDQSRAAICQAEAALSDARTKLGYCTVTAPISGHIATNGPSGGTYISGDGSPVTLTTIYDDATVLANFSIEDASFLRMFENPNNRDLIDYSAIPINFAEPLPHQYTANLDYLAPNVDASTGTIDLQAKIKNPYNELKAGMYCTIRMPYKVEPKAILIRDASISTDQLGKFIYVVNDSNKVVYTPIKVGDLVADTMRVVTSGIEPGQKYVTSAMLKVRDGMTVKPINK